MQTIIITSIIVAVVFFFLGFQFAKIRYMTKETLELLKIMNAYLSNEIDGETAIKRIRELEKHT